MQIFTEDEVQRGVVALFVNGTKSQVEHQLALALLLTTRVADYQAAYAEAEKIRRYAIGRNSIVSVGPLYSDLESKAFEAEVSVPSAVFHKTLKLLVYWCARHGALRMRPHCTREERVNAFSRCKPSAVLQIA